MGRIQSNIGLTSGIDIAGTVDQLMKISARPMEMLQSRVKNLQTQQVAYNELTALVIGVQLQTNRIGLPASFNTTKAASSKSDIVSAKVSGTAAAGNYNVHVLQTAQTATAASNVLTNASSTLQTGELVVRSGGFVDGSMALDDMRAGSGVSRGLIRITDRTGTSKEVDLRFATTLDDVLKSINNSGLKVSARTQGDRIVLNDTSGTAVSNLVVEEVGGGRTAADLGLGGVNVSANSATGDDIAFLGNSTRLTSLRDGRGIAMGFGNEMELTLKDGSTFQVNLDATSPPSTVGQLLAKVNSIASDKFELRVNASEDGFELIDKTSGGGQLEVSGRLANELGFAGKPDVAGVVSGDRVQSSLSGPLLGTLQGGKGIGQPGSISITNRQGTSTTIDLSSSESLRDVIDRINNSGSGVTASFNRSRTGIVLQDVTGGSAHNLVVADADANNTATKLGIAFDDAKNSVDSGSLNLQYVSEATELSSWNQGRGVRTGSFTITSADGQSKSVTVTPGTKTVGDLLELINANTIGVRASLNSQGDGISITDTSGGSGSLIIADNAGGNSAKDLGIVGTGSPGTGPNTGEQSIEGGQTFRMNVSDTETIADVVKRINDSNGPLTASLLTTGTNSVRVLFTSRATGLAGRMVIDGESIGLNVNSSGEARDAVISVGGSEVNGGLLVQSSSNTIENAIEGVSLTLHGSTTGSVDISVTKDNSGLEQNLQLFVDQFNKVRDKITEAATYDPETKTAGVLHGSGEILRLEQNLSRLLNHRSYSSGAVQSMQQLGIKFNDQGKLEFDKDKFNKLLASNPADVQAFLTQEKTGFGARAKTSLDAMIGVEKSTLVVKSQSIQKQIEASNKRIDTHQAKLDRERERLLLQFYRMEQNLAKINSNTTSLSSLEQVLENFKKI